MASEPHAAPKPADLPSLASESTQALLVRARAGDAAALEPLFARYLPRLRR